MFEQFTQYLTGWQICQLPLSSEGSKLFSFRGVSPPDSLTRGSAPGPRWGLCPQTPATTPPLQTPWPRHWAFRSHSKHYSASSHPLTGFEGEGRAGYKWKGKGREGKRRKRREQQEREGREWTLHPFQKFLQMTMAPNCWWQFDLYRLPSLEVSNLARICNEILGVHYRGLTYSSASKNCWAKFSSVQ